jgi:hypothetical protein
VPPLQAVRAQTAPGMTRTDEGATEPMPNPAGKLLSSPRLGEVGWVLLPLRAFLSIVFLYAGISKIADSRFLDDNDPTGIRSTLAAVRPGSPVGSRLRLRGHLLDRRDSDRSGTARRPVHPGGRTRRHAAVAVVLPHCELGGDALVHRRRHRLRLRVDPARARRCRWCLQRRRLAGARGQGASRRPGRPQPAAASRRNPAVRRPQPRLQAVRRRGPSCWRRPQSLSARPSRSRIR